MAVFSVNQATQFYVGTPTQKTNGTDTYFIVGGETTDRIKAGHVLSYSVNPVSDLNVVAPTPQIAVQTPVKGAEYLIRLIITTDSGPQYAYYKNVVVLSKDNTAASLATSIKEALDKAAKRDLAGEYYKVTTDSNTVTITPELVHTVGKRFVVPHIEVSVSEITGKDTNFDAEAWVAAYDSVATAEVEGSGLAKLKDLEYFCAGEKGDVYRGAAWPNDIPFESKLTGVEEAYQIHTVHYYEDLSNEAVQKSEKTMIIVTPSTVTDIFTSENYEDLSPENV